MTNADRLRRRIHGIARIGRSEGGGLTRISFTDEERASKELVASIEACLTVRDDAADDPVGRRERSEGDAPGVLTGSHIDYVSGVNLRRAAGLLLAAIEEAAQVMPEQVRRGAGRADAHRPYEEGARFSYGMIGSRAGGRARPRRRQAYGRVRRGDIRVDPVVSVAVNLAIRSVIVAKGEMSA